MKKSAVYSICLLGATISAGSFAEPPRGAIPPGAAALGYTRPVIYLTPTVDDISYDATSKNLFSGNWYDAPRPASTYSMTGGVLTLSQGGVLTTESRKSEPGALPLLLGSNGFYVEFAVKLSENDTDHFPAVWVMPQEHDVHQSDHQPGDPPHFERWMELDVNGAPSSIGGASIRSTNGKCSTTSIAIRST